jgi:pyrroloquinoline quinone biosynthesis protein D
MGTRSEPSVSVGTLSAKLHAKPSLVPKARLRLDTIRNAHFIVYPERALELGGSAVELVRRCDGTLTLEDVIRDVATEQGASLTEATEDALTFFAELDRRGLLVWR